MAQPAIRLDRRGIRALLTDPDVARAVHDLAEDVADRVRTAKPGAAVVVDDYETDRAATSVTIRDVRGLGWQVRDGLLTRAAAAVGLEVKERT